MRWITEILFIPIPSWRWRRVWQTSVWLLPSASPNFSEFAGAAVILLCVRQPGQSPKGSPKLVQSARGSFPLISFRFSLKAMNTLNWHKRPHLIFLIFACEKMGVFAVLEDMKAFPLAGLHSSCSSGCSSRTKVCLCAERQRKKEEKEERRASDRAITQPFGSDVLFSSQTGLDVSLPLICYCRGWSAGCRLARKLWSAGHNGLLIDSGEAYWGELLVFSFPGKTCRWTKNRPVDECWVSIKKWWYPQSETNTSEMLNLIPLYCK